MKKVLFLFPETLTAQSADCHISAQFRMDHNRSRLDKVSWFHSLMIVGSMHAASYSTIRPTVCASIRQTRSYLLPKSDSIIYRRSTNLACGGAKTFSHPPYSQYGFIYCRTESCFEHFGGFDMALPRGFLNFYLEPPNLPPFIPKWPPHQEPKNRWNFFSWFLFIFWLNSVIWCLYQLSMIFFWFVMQFFIKKIYFVNLGI